MAINSRYTDVWIGAYDLSGSNNSCEVSLNTPVIDVTAFQNDGKVWLVDNPDAMITHAGYFKTGTGEQEDVLYSGTATPVTLAAVFGTNQTIPIGYVLPLASNRKMNVTAAAGSVIAASGEWGGVNAHRGGVAFNSTISSTGAQTSIDLASAGSSGGYAYVFIQTITGTATSATIDIESSTDDAAFASEGTATFSAVGVQTVTMSGTVNRYVRLNCTSLGGATSFAIGAVVCTAGVTY